MPDIPAWAIAARRHWQYDGSRRPDFAQAPGPDQESVWDYPRPPGIEPDARRITVCFEGHCVADSNQALRVLETAGAPVFYLPPEHVNTDWLRLAAATSRCEWKGIAEYWNLTIGHQQVSHAAWSYPDPFPEYAALQGYFAFYPGLLRCQVDDQPVQPQPGGLYGGWVTPDIAGPIKGDPGTESW